MIELYDEISKDLDAASRRNNSRIKAEDLRSAVIALRARQFIFESASPGHFQILRAMKSSLEPHFYLSGLRMIVNDTEGYVSLVPEDDVSSLSLTIDETILLLSLRGLFEIHVQAGNVAPGGLIVTSEEELQQFFETKSGRAWPRRQIVKNTLENFERRNLLTITTDSDGNRVFLLNSTLRVVTGRAYLSRLDDFANSRARLNTAPVQSLTETGTVEEGISE